MVAALDDLSNYAVTIVKAGRLKRIEASVIDTSETYRRKYFASFRRPVVSRVSVNSPLTVELLITGVLGTGGVSTLVYLFKNPEKLGEWWPKLQTSWYDGRSEAEKARRAYKALRAGKADMRELEGESSPAE
ncbi:hypothetical protein HerbRD11066_14060 [Herbidospora sp. RD11066]